MGDLTKNFSKHEVICRCGCGKVEMDEYFMLRLQEARTYHKKPMIINSGFRCPIYNKKINGSVSSSHLKGLAVDIKCETTEERFRLLESLFVSNFYRIGIGEDFIHVDLDADKPQCIVWLY